MGERERATADEGSLIALDGDVLEHSARWWESRDIEELWHGVFKGGGAKGIAYAGALHAVAENNRWFKSVAGSSAGAITATLIAAGLTPKDIEALTPLLLDRVKRNWFGLLLGGATPIYSISGVTAQLRTTLLEQLSRLGHEGSTTTFADLWDATRIDLYVVGMDLATGQPIVFNHLTTPECDVPLAVAASCAIPVAFDAGRLVVLDPLSFNGMAVHRVVDGGAWANYPAFVFKDTSFRSHTGLPSMSDDERVVGFVLDQGDRLSGGVPWAFRPELEADETADLGLYLRSPRLRAVLGQLDKTRWRLLTFVFWPLAMCAITTSALISNDFGLWRQLESLLAGWVGRAILGGTFAAAAAVLIVLALTFYALGRQIIRTGIGTVVAAMSVATDVPGWLGAAPGDHVVRVPVPRIGTARFRVSDAQRAEMIEAAHRICGEQVRNIIAGTDSAPSTPNVRSTDLPKPDDVTLRERSHESASRFALGNGMLLLTFAFMVFMGNVIDALLAGLPVDWSSILSTILVLLIPAVLGIAFYRRGKAEREATRRKEQQKALEHRPGEPVTVQAAKLLTLRKTNRRIRRRILAACLITAAGIWFVLETTQDFRQDTGTATVVAREDVTRSTFIYDVVVDEGQGEGAGERWRFDSHTRLKVGDRVTLRFVGGDQGLEVASDGPQGVGVVILLLSYLVAMNLLGVWWARADRAWLLRNPEMQAPEDRERRSQQEPSRTARVRAGS